MDDLINTIALSLLAGGAVLVTLIAAFALEYGREGARGLKMTQKIRKLEFKVPIWGECKLCNKDISCVVELRQFTGLAVDEIYDRAETLLWGTHEKQCKGAR